MNGPASKTAEGQAHARTHGLGTKVAYPDPNNAHVKGIAFDAIVYNGKTALNGEKFTTKELQDVAALCGLSNNIKDDYVDFTLS